MMIKTVSAEQTLAVRAEVLRPGQSLSACVFAGDHDPHTRHFGAVDPQAADPQECIIGVASIYRVAHPDIKGEPQYQLRGMAIQSAYRGQGIGELLLGSCEQYAQACGAALMWANARSSALEFYRKLGYHTVSEEFEMASVGPHCRVMKALS